MQNLFKFVLLLFFLNTSSFAEFYYFYFYNENGNIPKKYDYSGDPNSYIRIGNNIYKSRLGYVEYLHSNSDFDKSSLYRFGGDNGRPFIFEKSQPKKVGCLSIVPHDTFQSKSDCSEEMYNPEDPDKNLNLHAFRFLELDLVTICQPGEHFNTDTNQCQKCNAGQSWDQENNRCYDDCSDVNNNKWGYTDGSCTDCSNSKTSDEVKDCYCKSIGSKPALQSVELHIGGGLWFTFCQDGSQFQYKKPNTPDNPGNGNQGGDNGGGSGGNNNGNNQGNGNSGGGSGGNQGGDNGGGSGGNNNGNNQGNGNSGGGSGGSGSGNGNGKDPKFNPGDFDFKDLQNDVNDFKRQYINGLNTMMGGFDNLKDGINQFIANVQGKGMNAITKKNVPTTCPRKYTIDFNGYPSELNFDFCKIVSSSSGAFYHLFYVIFFLGFLVLIVKLLIFSF